MQAWYLPLYGSSSSSSSKRRMEIEVPHELDHKKIVIYQLPLQFIGWAADLTVERSDSTEGKKGRMGSLDPLMCVRKGRCM